MAPKVSKNQRTSSSNKPVHASAESGSRFVPLGLGHCYFRAADGRTLHRKVEAEDLFELIAAYPAAVRAKIVAELDEQDQARGADNPQWGILRDRVAAVVDAA